MFYCQSSVASFICMTHLGEGYRAPSFAGRILPLLMICNLSFL